MNPIILVKILILFLSSISSSAIALEKNEQEAKPTIGLVLSGGGARGAAHIGVLKYLEEKQIPIDLIVGTSMGAVVGGLYSSGLSAKEIEAVFTNGDLSNLFEDRPPRATRSFRRKQDDDGFFVDFDLGIKSDGIVLPQGLIQGQNLVQTLKRLMLPVEHIEHFDQLPIPFRAIATDIEHGTAVALEQGDLATAIRASMSLPGIFRPVKIDEHILVDGGVANNLPINIAREMGADILIVVDVGFPLKPFDKLKSALDVTRQMLTIMIKQRADQQRATLSDQDILILPSLGDLDSREFHRLQEALQIGYASSVENAQALAVLQHQDHDQPDLHRQKRLELTQELENQKIHKIRIDTPARLSPELIRDRLRFKEGESLDLDILEEDIAHIYALDTFESVKYSIEPSDTGIDLRVSATEKSWGPHYLRFGINLEDDFSGTSTYNLAARYTWMELNHLGGEFRSEFRIGNEPQFKMDFYQPLDTRGRWFFNPSFRIGRNNSLLFVNENKLAEFTNREVAYALAFGREFGDWGELRLSWEREHQSNRIRIGNPLFGSDKETLAALSLRFQLDTLDKPSIPRTGSLFSIQYAYADGSLGSDVNVSLASLAFIKPVTRGKHTLLNIWNFGGVVEDNNNEVDGISLGGFLSLSGYAPEELDGRYGGFGALAYYYRLGRTSPGFFDTPVYLGFSIEAGYLKANPDQLGSNELLTAGSAFIVLDTFLGPLYLAYGHAGGEHSSAYLFLGQTF